MIPRHDFAFDPTYGYDLDALLAVPAPEAPADFERFWRETHARASAVSVAPKLGPVEWEADGLRFHGVSFTSTDGFRIGGWLSLPIDGEITRARVVAHGYGGRDRPEVRVGIPGTATIWPCARGLPTRSLHPDLPSDAQEHVLHGIGSRETYIHRGCVADMWCAATALGELVPESTGVRLDYVGSSFGGGIGPFVLAFDDRFTSGALVVPSFGNHPLRVTLPCTGSGAAVRDLHARRPEVLDVLAYFDSATAATFVRRPVHVGAALFDPSVPPPGQFAVYNALGGPKELFVMETGHFAHPEEAAQEEALTQAQYGFMTA
ncbi:acetylxylan esterase [Nonomuraea dietziae]|uniref:Cephalosporin-C deacetylase n=1 Tax=Nonomuraea dietziae TaxID=65515 RepID=A0A7W5V617_9ACTN|nr:acetylxylan esterase [Nonomuraea dietziae]MBB3725535.1 cephalosporin-C deacetylase [Nonomuraea dietziae]